MRADMRTLLGVALLLAFAAMAHSLQCYTCHSFNQNCTLNATGCNVTQHQTCRSLTVREKGRAHDHEYIINGCGNCLGLISFNSGPYSAFLHATCCNSDLCNDQVEPEREDKTPNGLECEGCFALTESGCNRSMAAVKCYGQQDRCIHTSGTLHWLDTTTYVFKGCASHFVCHEQNALPIFGLEPNYGFYCCQGSRCNLEFRNLTRTTTLAPTTSKAAPALNIQALLGTCLLLALRLVVV
ncbi:urokinase plasminogen activator surface receptor-like [Pristis pectinata]|uniref:urokinase plasminogen activator surface receptor-like n=1 Tax=Pristis pectinata TaxID=685728 RepID=UPI00223D4BBA|nr:urokinase plasminogen activator surface receptor-like [Pristis pectinata]